MGLHLERKPLYYQRSPSPVFIRSRLPMTHMNRENFHGNRSARFSEMRNTDTQIHRQPRQI